MSARLTTRQGLDLWRSVTSASVISQGPDLSARQMAILLIVYLDPPPHTVRGLAAELNIAKPVVTRALDSMGQMGLIRRKRDDADKRNVLVQRTVKGAVYLSEFADIVTAASGLLDDD